MRIVKWTPLVGLMVLALIIWPPMRQASGQEDAAKAILGVGEETISQGSGSARLRVEFFQDGDKFNWKWNTDLRSSKYEAEGTVTKIALPALELQGKYTSHPSREIVNSPMTVSLVVQGDQIQGNGLTAAVNRGFTVSLTRKK